MKTLVFFVGLVPSLVFATTLLETGTAVGIANTLQGTAVTSSQDILDKTKQTVKEYEEAQKKAEENRSLTPSIAEESALVQEGDHSEPSRLEETPPQPPENSENLPQASSYPPEGAELLSKRDLNLSEPSIDEDSLRDLTKEDLNERFQDTIIQQEAKPVDYKTSMQVFYKKQCPPSKTSSSSKQASSSKKKCNRGALLTNIKSVIFDYAHTRGSFANSEE